MADFREKNLGKLLVTFTMEFILNSHVQHLALLLGGGELAIEKLKPLIRPLRTSVHRTLPKRYHREAPKSSIAYSPIKFSSISVGCVRLTLGFAELAFPPPWKFCQINQFSLAGGLWFWAKLFLFFNF